MSKKLVAYFSAGGVTRTAVETLDDLKSMWNYIEWYVILFMLLRATNPNLYV